MDLSYQYLKLQCSGAQKKVYQYSFMKQKCQIQMSIAQYENTSTVLRTQGIKPHISTLKQGVCIALFEL